MSRIRLYPSQAAHVDALDGILDRSHYALDLSVMGSGKTFAGTAIYMKRRLLHVMVVAPLTVLPAWEKVLHDHDIHHAKLMTYDSLAGKADQTALKHGYLTRTDREDVSADGNKTIKTTSFAATALLRQHVEEGMLFICDEVQYVKNIDSQRAKAARAIADVMEERFSDDPGRGRGRSRVLLLSGSPVDRAHQCANLLMLLNVTRHDYLMYKKQAMGVSDITEYSMKLNAAQTCEVIPKHVLGSPKACEALVYQLFQEVIKPAVSHVMPNPAIPHTLFKFNGQFLAADEDDLDALDDGIEALRSAVGGSYRRGQGGYNRNLVGQLGAALCKIEKGKRHLLTRLARQTLQASATIKVVLAVNCLETMDALAAALQTYRPLLLRGDVKLAERRNVLDKFQAPDGEHRLVIGNTQVLSTGIGLHDTHGGFPRVCFVSPTYRTIDLYQLGHRFWRRGVRSDAQLYMVYVKDHMEDRILSNEMRKGEVMQATTEEQVSAGQVFPGTYPVYAEQEEEVPIDAAAAARAPAEFVEREARRIEAIDAAEETQVECVYHGAPPAVDSDSEVIVLDSDTDSDDDFGLRPAVDDADDDDFGLRPAVPA